MATLRSFKCGGCGYHVYSSGGPDTLMRAHTTSIACATCRRVMDVATRLVGHGSPSSGDAVRDRAPTCAVDPAHDVTLWGRPYPCPGCGASMDEDPEDCVLAD